MADQKPSKSYFYGTGRRKTAVAQVRLYPNSTGKCTVNGTVIETVEQQMYSEPLKLAGLFGTTDISVHVHGGGFHSQLEAIRHGITRALVVADENLKTTLKKSGFLTRDPREKERKKFGLKSARRSPQWSKR